MGRKNRISVRRPLAAAGFGWLAAQWAAMLADIRFSFACAACLLAAGVFLLLSRRGKKLRLTALVLAVCGVSFAVTGIYRTLAFDRVRGLQGQPAALSGTVCEEPELSGSRYYYVIRTDSLVPEGSLRDYGTVKLRLSSRTPLNARKYDRVTISKAYLSAPKGGAGYTSRANAESKGIALTGTFSSHNTAVQSGERPWYAFTDALHEKISGALHLLLPQEEAGLACGILLGEKSGLPEELIENFRACGISHLLVVSGLHLSFLILGLQRLLQRLLRRKRLAAGLCLPVLLLFMAVVGFTPSVLRSGIMMAVFLLAILLFRTADSRTSLAAAVWVICLSNPCAAGDVGLQLSFLATLGIQCCSGRWCSRVFRQMPRRLADFPVSRRLVPALCTTLSASLFTLPVTLAAFGTVSLIAPLVNLFAELPAQLLLQLSLFTALLQLIGLPLPARAAALLSGLLARALSAMTGFFARLAPGVSLSSAGWMLLAAAGLLLAALCLWFPRAKRLPLCSVLLMAALLAGSADVADFAQRQPRVTLFRCSGGIAAAVFSEEESVLLLCDCGNAAIDACSDAFAQRCPDILLLPGGYDRAAALAARAALREQVPQQTILGSRRVPDELRFLRRNALLSSGDEQLSCGGITVQQIKTQTGLWYRVIVGQTVVLIPAGECDAAELNTKYRCADVLVLGASVRNLSAIVCKTVLVSSDGASDQMLCSSAAKTGGRVYSTEQNGSLTLFLEREKAIFAWN
ncbi:MAG: ComEC/Rec2 family competence protein [Firmicutes bacterium]|nr:ComEC/Rec2 family competence protein [Bacillota bacterium]